MTIYGYNDCGESVLSEYNLTIKCVNSFFIAFRDITWDMLTIYY